MFQGTRTQTYGNMNLSELHFASELKRAVVYLANQNGRVQNLVSTTENRI